MERRESDRPRLVLVEASAATRHDEPAAPEPVLREVYGQILRDARRDQDRTLDDVAGQVGMSKQYLSEVERGRKEPSSEMIAAICGALHMPVEHLLARSVRRISSARSVTSRSGVTLCAA